MNKLTLLLIASLLSGCSWLCKDNSIVMQDPAAEAIKVLQLNFDPLPVLDLTPYQTDKIPLYIKKPTQETKFEVDYDWIQKNEQLLIELQNRIDTLQQRDQINKELFEKAKAVGQTKPK